MARSRPQTTPTRTLVLLMVLIVVLAVASVRFFSQDSGPGGGRRGDILDYSTHDVPELAFTGTPGVGAEVGASLRNPFTFGAPPTPTPNLTPPPTPVPRPTMPPRPTPTPRPRRADGLPPPPPFTRDFTGFFGPQRLPVAVFKEGEEWEVAVPGDVLDDTFIVRDIVLEGDQTAVIIGFVGYPEEETTRVPLAQN